jgi:hypothetical protein
MIKPNDLRIGNLLEYYINEEGIEWEASALDWQDLRWCTEANENFNKVHRGIPLTEDWLVKLGFVKYGVMFHLPPLTIIFNSEKKQFIVYIGLDESTSYYPKFVHQLQNLYFALTGEELTVHETK